MRRPPMSGQGDVPWTVMADPEGNVFCVLEPRELYQDTGPIAAVVVDCADPRAMARFWGEAIDWTVHELTDDFARLLRSAKGVGPYLEFVRTPDRGDRVEPRPLDVLPHPSETTRQRWPACAPWAPPTPTWARATSRGPSWPTRKATSSASCAEPDARIVAPGPQGDPGTPPWR